MIFLRLFIAFVQVGLFTFGGGYAMLPLVQQQVVQAGWMTGDEFTDLLAISQMTPGPIAINTATFVGLKMGGIPGAFVASFSFILPSVIIVSLLAYLYRKYNEIPVIRHALLGIRPAATGLIIAAAGAILGTALFGAELSAVSVSNVNIIALVLTACGVVLLRVFKPPILAIIAGCGAAGGVLYTIL